MKVYACPAPCGKLVMPFPNDSAGAVENGQPAICPFCDAAVSQVAP